MSVVNFSLVEKLVLLSIFNLLIHENEKLRMLSSSNFSMRALFVTFSLVPIQSLVKQ